MMYFPLHQHPHIVNAHYEGLYKLLNSRIKRHVQNVPLKDLLLTNVKDILCSHPQKLYSLNNSITKEIKELRLEVPLNKIFNYKSFYKSPQNKYDAYKLAENLNIRTCLYCNRNYTLTVINQGDKLTRPEFDHFFCQIKFPLLSLSIYNLIPSCHICNSTFKRAKKFSLRKNLHPYINDAVPYYHYAITPTSTEASLGIKSDYSISIQVISDEQTLKEKINTTKKIFNLEEIMASHGNEWRDLFLIHNNNTQKYLSILKETFKKMNFSDEDIYRVLYGTESEPSQFINRPLSKIKKDIVDYFSKGNTPA